MPESATGPAGNAERQGIDGLYQGCLALGAEMEDAVRQVHDLRGVVNITIDRATLARWVRYGQRVDMLRAGETTYVAAPDGLNTYMARELLNWLKRDA